MGIIGTPKGDVVMRTNAHGIDGGGVDCTSTVKATAVSLLFLRLNIRSSILPTTTVGTGTEITHKYPHDRGQGADFRGRTAHTGSQRAHRMKESACKQMLVSNLAFLEPRAH